MLTIFTGRVGDHNDLAAPAARFLGERVVERHGCASHVVGTPAPALGAGWTTELAAAHDPLAELAGAVRAAGSPWLTVMPRCAGALATVPAVLDRRPDAVVVWFDAHADLHTPETTTSGYLGGMALSGPLGWWDSGFGGIAARPVLAGTRDIDEGEQQLIVEREVAVVPPGPDVAGRLLRAIGDAPVYVHLDCDVLEPGVVPTDYRVPGGLGLDDVHRCMTGLSGLEVLGLEIAELQLTETGEVPDVEPLLDSLGPLLTAVATSS